MYFLIKTDIFFNLCLYVNQWRIFPYSTIAILKKKIVFILHPPPYIILQRCKYHVSYFLFIRTIYLDYMNWIYACRKNEIYKRTLVLESFLKRYYFQIFGVSKNASRKNFKTTGSFSLRLNNWRLSRFFGNYNSCINVFSFFPRNIFFHSEITGYEMKTYTNDYSQFISRLNFPELGKIWQSF